MAGRYAHAKPFKRHRRQLRSLRTWFERLIRDIRRKIVGQPQLEATFERSFSRAAQIRSQEQRQRGYKALFLPCARSRMHRQGQGLSALWFGVKASIVTTNTRTPGGQFVLHAKALPGNPYDGHTLGDVNSTETLTGRAIERAYGDKGYRGHKTENPRRVFISGQKCGVFGVIKRELSRRSAIEPRDRSPEDRRTPRPLPPQGARGRCRQRHPDRRGAQSLPRLAWLGLLLRLILNALMRPLTAPAALKSVS